MIIDDERGVSLTPPRLRKTSTARAIGLRNVWSAVGTKHLHKIGCGGNLYHAMRTLSNATVAYNAFADPGKREKTDKNRLFPSPASRW
jgi:hypothetical protein